MENSQVIGIDLGGTAIKLGRFAPDGTCLRALSVPTPQPSTPEAVVDAMVEAIAEIDPQRLEQVRRLLALPVISTLYLLRNAWPR